MVRSALRTSFVTVVAAVLWAAAAGGDPPVVTELTLVDADRNREIGPLEDGAVVDLQALGTVNLSVVARAERVGSVHFSVNDGERVRVENIAPYAIAGDEGGTNYHAWTPEPGTVRLRVTPYAASDADGVAGEPHVVTFSVVGEADPTLGIGQANAAASRDDTTPSAQEGGVGRAVPRQRFDITTLDTGGVAGSVLLSDYGRHVTLLVSLLDATNPGPYTAVLARGGCRDAAPVDAKTLEPVAGPGAFATTHLEVNAGELAASPYHVRVFPTADPGGEPFACGVLEVSQLQ